MEQRQPPQKRLKIQNSANSALSAEAAERLPRALPITGLWRGTQEVAHLDKFRECRRQMDEKAFEVDLDEIHQTIV
jgi:hypothetical protein